MTRFIAAFLMLGTTTSTAAFGAGFCVDDLADLPLHEEMLSPDAVLFVTDHSYAQISCLGCDTFQQIEFFLGQDPRNQEAALRAGDPDVASLCDDDIPNCQQDIIKLGGAIGLRSSYTTAPFAQAKTVLYSNNQSLNIRVTHGQTDPEWAAGTVDAVLQTLTPHLFEPC